jgi:hypothetical protein
MVGTRFRNIFVDVERRMAQDKASWLTYEVVKLIMELDPGGELSVVL